MSSRFSRVLLVADPAVFHVEPREHGDVELAEVRSRALQ
jgi:hypothetical protein